jgi:hypothetical protein
VTNGATVVNWIVIVAVCSAVALYVIYLGARIVSRVWFNAKLSYQRQLIAELAEGEDNGQSTRK